MREEEREEEKEERSEIENQMNEDVSGLVAAGSIATLFEERLQREPCPVGYRGNLHNCLSIHGSV